MSLSALVTPEIVGIPIFRPIPVTLCVYLQSGGRPAPVHCPGGLCEVGAGRSAQPRAAAGEWTTPLSAETRHSGPVPARRADPDQGAGGRRVLRGVGAGG